MPLTKIEVELEIPEGFEFDRIDNKTKAGDYDFDGRAWNLHAVLFGSPRIILRKKQKPAYRVYFDPCCRCTFTAERDVNGNANQILPGNTSWLTDWIEYDPHT